MNSQATPPGTVSRGQLSPRSFLKERKTDLWAAAAYATYMAWSFVCFFKPSFFSAQAEPFESSMLIASSLSAFSTLILAVLFAKALGTASEKKGALMAVATTASLGTAGTLFPLADFGSISTIAAAILTGASSALLFSALGARMFAADQRWLMLDILAGAFVSLFASALFIVMPDALSQAAGVLLPFGCAGCLVAGRGTTGAPGTQKEPRAASEDLSAAVPGLVKALVCILVLRFESSCLVFPFRTSNLPELAVPLAQSIASLALIAAVVLAIAHGTRSSKFDSIVVYRTTIFFALVGLALLPLALSPAVYFGFETTFYSLLKALALLFALRFSSQSGLSPWLTSAFALLMLRAAGLAASLVLETFPIFGLFAEEHLPQLDCTMIVLVLIVYLFVFTESDVLRLFEKSRKLTPQEIMERRCVLVADRYGLSPRETEVLTLLSQGRSAPHIASQLYLSVGTVNMYLHKTYRKLGVHSKQEALDIVEKAQDE